MEVMTSFPLFSLTNHPDTEPCYKLLLYQYLRSEHLGYTESIPATQKNKKD